MWVRYCFNVYTVPVECLDSRLHCIHNMRKSSNRLMHEDLLYTLVSGEATWPATET